MWRLILFCLCFSTLVNAENKGIVVSGGTNSFSVKFDFLLDENIDDSDPRIKSIIYSMKSYGKSTVSINYSNSNANSLAQNLAQIFNQHKLLVLNPQLVSQSKEVDNKNVLVTIYYQE